MALKDKVCLLIVEKLFLLLKEVAEFHDGSYRNIWDIHIHQREFNDKEIWVTVGDEEILLVKILSIWEERELKDGDESFNRDYLISSRAFKVEMEIGSVSHFNSSSLSFTVLNELIDELKKSLNHLKDEGITIVFDNEEEKLLIEQYQKKEK